MNAKRLSAALPNPAQNLGDKGFHALQRKVAHGQDGVVLPIALIMLVILTIAGLLAARNASVTEQVSNNLRTANVAQQAAESGLRYCEAVTIDKVDNAGKLYTADVAKIETTLELASATDVSTNAKWKTLTNWSNAANYIAVPITFYQAGGTDVKATSKLNTAPACMIQVLSPKASNIYLITAKGTSNSGSTVYLQSLLSPGSPTVN